MKHLFYNVTITTLISYGNEHQNVIVTKNSFFNEEGKAVCELEIVMNGNIIHKTDDLSEAIEVYKQVKKYIKESKETKVVTFKSVEEMIQFFLDKI